jgi:hypothetical protein
MCKKVIKKKTICTLFKTLKDLLAADHIKIEKLKSKFV